MSITGAGTTDHLALLEADKLMARAAERIEELEGRLAKCAAEFARVENALADACEREEKLRLQLSVLQREQAARSWYGCHEYVRRTSDEVSTNHENAPPDLFRCDYQPCPREGLYCPIRKPK